MIPILFNTEMVMAILDGRKTCTRRVIKPQPKSRVVYCNKVWQESVPTENGIRILPPPYAPGEILYVRETWQFIPCIDCEAYLAGICNSMPIFYEDRDSVREGCFEFRADYPKGERIVWRPSIHMPKEAARTFLRVTNVRVERLQDITEDGARSEGCFHGPLLDGCDDFMVPALYSFQSVWDSIVKKTGRDTYGWAANPWVWVIEFERCGKPEEDNHADSNPN